ncbi:dTDP-4-dehydrorhamnose reductase [Lacinutrix neustonica]|uniref:dTDP-4-dehydrorhamnose reductase n=1 Tax=Lacinutrix neustonica TaxID=2980107 RepID=A0A9E8SCV5_9FLAO|nr:dTDP-4-dehydrorhamnose reductase [Lacinutrix neustonica]WAC01067.1 dTDP-4-dehydrorhamnose reductase [Lacinutrix neustonica]
MKKIVVVGAKGQLGLCIKALSNGYPSLDFLFLDSNALDVSSAKQVETLFRNTPFDYCINCAAYTAVDKAEDEKQLAYKINTLGVKFLAESCKKHQVTLIHISTDFVFDGKSTTPYKEKDVTHPLGVYGATKLAGEKEIAFTLKNYYILRTSWLYSHFGSNFVKTMLRLAKEKKELNVVNDQIGTPTYGPDLADVIFKIILFGPTKYGLYHFSNLGSTTWYEFARAIFEMTNANIEVHPVDSNTFVTKAERPKYSVLDKSKIMATFGIEIPTWRESLEKMVTAMET